MTCTVTANPIVFKICSLTTLKWRHKIYHSCNLTRNSTFAPGNGVIVLVESPNLTLDFGGCAFSPRKLTESRLGNLQFMSLHRPFDSHLQLATFQDRCKDPVSHWEQSWGYGEEPPKMCTSRLGMFPCSDNMGSEVSIHKHLVLWPHCAPSHTYTYTHPQHSSKHTHKYLHTYAHCIPVLLSSF